MGAVVDQNTGEKHIRYVAVGKRMSGDMNTALGNSLINAFVLSTAFTDADIFIDGDDSVIITTQPPSIHTIVRRCAECGFAAKVQIANRLEQIEFCQARLVRTRHGPQFVRNPRKVLETIQLSARRYPEWLRERVFQAKLLCELAMNIDIPVTSALYDCLDTSVKPFFSDEDSAIYQHRAQFRCRRPDVDPDTRSSYALAWDISIEQQLILEWLLRCNGSGVPVVAELPAFADPLLEYIEQDGSFDPADLPQTPYPGDYRWPIEDLIEWH